MGNVVQFGVHPDPDNVEVLCKQQPWCKDLPGNISSLSAFGTVVEQFERAAKAFPEGSEQHSRYQEASRKAIRLYHDQIRGSADQLSKVKDRREIEQVNERLWRIAKDREKDGTYVSKRLIWLAQVAGEKFMQDWKPKRQGYGHYGVGPPRFRR